MSFMFEVYYRGPTDKLREQKIVELVRGFGGNLDFREEPSFESDPNSIVLTFEFEDLGVAEEALRGLKEQGEYVQGPYPYG